MFNPYHNEEDISDDDGHGGDNDGDVSHLLP